MLRLGDIWGAALLAPVRNTWRYFVGCVIDNDAHGRDPGVTLNKFVGTEYTLFCENFEPMGKRRERGFKSKVHNGDTHEHGDLRLKYNGKHVVVEIFAQGITKYRAQKKVEQALVLLVHR